MNQKKRFLACKELGCSNLSFSANPEMHYCMLRCDEISDSDCEKSGTGCHECQCKIPQNCPWILELVMMTQRKVNEKQPTNKY